MNDPTRTSRQAQGLRELAYVEVASNELTRDINRDVILERIRALQPIARVDLARASGLQPSTVSSIVETLLKEQWIREGAIVKTARGRRPTMLSLNDDLVILAVDVRPLQAVIAAVDLNGRFLSPTGARYVSHVTSCGGRRVSARLFEPRPCRSSRSCAVYLLPFF